jgi:hypothetical protein
MAKYTTTVGGSLNELVAYIKHNESRMGSTITLEEEITGTADSVKYWGQSTRNYCATFSFKESLTYYN